MHGDNTSRYTEVPLKKVAFNLPLQFGTLWAVFKESFCSSWAAYPFGRLVKLLTELTGLASACVELVAARDPAKA